MTLKLSLGLLVCVMSAAFFSCGNNKASETTTGADSTASSGMAPSIREESISYTLDTLMMNGYVAYDEHKQGKLPVVLVVHEWWGMNDYVKMRARQLAELGYLAMAVDMYGGGKVAQTPDEAKSYAGAFYGDPKLGFNRLQAAFNKAKTLERADTTRMAAIGYCFGGTQVLNAGKMGMPLKAVVSFHGGLPGVPPQKDVMTSKFLVCHGGADKNATEKDVETFKKQMDAAGATYTFKVYANATHAFTNPDATKVGKQYNMPIEYNGAADTASWNDMRAFLSSTLK